ncbi:thiamine-phosphate kinase [Leucobacter sp. NPDC015123]|uniref:thiamine-phosphate kinase n=1 Tax=Leucobacter sp. NPDC015123 TaxID=3364129 RepID=UPI0036F45A89
MQTVGELGEAGVLARILDGLESAAAASVGPGDDCAVLRASGDIVVTTDTMIEGPDFRLAWHTGFDLGWKLAATNLSDVAAMGATPTGLTVALACPKSTPVSLLAEIARGLSAACAELAPGCGVVGGDLGQAPVLTAAVTALGDLEGREPMLRSGARPGDTVAYSGALGLAGMGLALLFDRCADGAGVAHSEGLAELREAHSAELRAQFAPRAPILTGRVASESGATAMMDVSDGLALDAARLARASQVQVRLSGESLSAAYGVQQGVTVPLRAMLEGGEDHGLLATFPPGVALPAGFLPIGVVAEVGGSSGEPSQGSLSVNGEPYAPGGWDPYNKLTTLSS